jgi:hypothetical protein
MLDSIGGVAKGGRCIGNKTETGRLAYNSNNRCNSR